MLPKPRIEPTKLLSEEIGCWFFAPTPKAPNSVIQPHESQNSSEVANPQRFQCERCSRHFVSEKGLSQHIGKKHNFTGKYSRCPRCSKKFRTKYAVRFHINQVHDKSTRVRCGMCGIEYYNKYSMKSHICHLHSN